MELKEALRKRKSVRCYKETQISDEALRYILFAAQAAPISRKAYSDIHITVVQNAALRKEMEKIYDENGNSFYGAPTLILVSSKELPKKEMPYLNVAGMIENMLLACTDLGLGSIYLTSFIEKVFKDEKIKYKLGIKEEYMPIAAVGVGYPAHKEVIESKEEIEKRITINRV